MRGMEELEEHEEHGGAWKSTRSKEEHGGASGARLEGVREGDWLRDDSVVAYVGDPCHGIN